VKIRIFGLSLVAGAILAPLNTQAGPVTDACQGLVSYFRAESVRPVQAIGAPVTLRSSFLKADSRVSPLLERIAEGSLIYPLRLPERRPEYRDLSVKLVSALRYAGMEPAGFTNGSLIDREAIRRIDDALLLAEPMVAAHARKMPFFSRISGGDLRSNLPQSFAAYIYVTFFELVEAGHAGYQNLSEDCLMATLYPKTCSVFAGTGAEMANRCELLKPPFTVQSPGLFGFFTSDLQGRADMRVGPDELPNFFSFPSTLGTMSGVVHESGHELDSFFADDSQTMHRFYPRRACGKFMDNRKRGSPFNKGTGIDSDYVTGYSSGSFNPDHDYRQWETFAESLTAFLLTPEYFRALAARSPKLQQQYDYLRTRVIGAEFDNPALKGRADFKWIPTDTGEFDKYNPVDCFVPGEISPR
jgi:hypothetical protein